jgi:hypothetical protein
LIRRALAAPIAAGFILIAFSDGAGAAPQASATLTLGAAANGYRDRLWSETRFAGGFRAELLGWRERDADVGMGPYVELLTTTSFHDLQLGAGASVLLPVHEYLPIVLSAGPYARKTSIWGWEPGVAGSLFWGSHGFNYHSWYALSAGLLIGVRYGLGDAREVSISGGMALDLEILAMPFLLLWEAVRR